MDINQLILYDYIEKHPEQGSGLGVFALVMMGFAVVMVLWSIFQD